MSEEWDVEKYKNQYEPEEQWELRRKFMEAHKDTFPEERVVCLAQVLVNVEFLGTKYPDETMRTVAGLAADIIGEFRERQKNRLQRTFVGAAEAASAKVQGKNFTKKNTLSHTDEKSSVPSQSEAPKDGKRKMIMEDEGGASTEKKRNKVNVNSSHDGSASKRPDSKTIAGLHPKTGRKNRPYRNPKMILAYLQRDLEKTPFPFTSVVRNSARLASIQLETSTHRNEAEQTWISSVVFDGAVIATATGEQKASLKSAFEKTYELLKTRHYQLVIEDPEATSVFAVLTDAQDELEMMENGLKKDTISKTVINNSSAESTSSAEGAGQSSVALNMMKMMGWTAGSGLGAQKQGITQPIQADVMIGRSGFGSNTDSQFKNAIRTKLQEYLSSNALYKLTFTNEFTPEQRAVIHELARSLGLKTKSIGNKINRVLTVRRPGSAGVPEVFSIVQRLKEMKESHPLFTKARLIPPSDV